MYKKHIKVIKDDFEKKAKEIEKKGTKYTLNDIIAFGSMGAALTAMMELEEEKEEMEEEVRDCIKEELKSAEYYYKMCAETNDPNYKQMAKDGLRHADFFIKQARMTATDVESEKKIQTYTNWYNTILERLG